jgi:hypothetical protein
VQSRPRRTTRSPIMMCARIHHLVHIPAETICLEGALAHPAGAHGLMVPVPGHDSRQDRLHHTASVRCTRSVSGGRMAPASQREAPPSCLVSRTTWHRVTLSSRSQDGREACQARPVPVPALSRDLVSFWQDSVSGLSGACTRQVVGVHSRPHRPHDARRVRCRRIPRDTGRAVGCETDPW